MCVCVCVCVCVCACVCHTQVAKGRHMSIEAVRKIAGGRVYTGEQAKEVRTSLLSHTYTHTHMVSAGNRCT